MWAEFVFVLDELILHLGFLFLTKVLSELSELQLLWVFEWKFNMETESPIMAECRKI